MKNIYKREPIQRSLPSNYDDLDAVSYHNLNAFKGLQVYDNPLIADKDSTYDSLNVYIDEHANLTVRPALITDKVFSIPVYWEYYTQDDTRLYLTSAGADYILIASKNGVLLDQLNFDKLPVVVPAESDDLYVFVKTDVNTLYKLTHKFELVVGTILLDDPVQSDISHYNILNDKVYHQYTGSLPNERYDDMFVTVSKFTVYFDKDQPFKIESFGDLLVIASYQQMVITTKDSIARCEVDTAFQKSKNDWTIERFEDGIGVTVNCFNDAGVLLNVKYFKIDFAGNIIQEYTVTSTLIDSYIWSGYRNIIIAIPNGNDTYTLWTRKITEDISITDAPTIVYWTKLNTMWAPVTENNSNDIVLLPEYFIELEYYFESNWYIYMSWFKYDGTTGGLKTARVTDGLNYISRADKFAISTGNVFRVYTATGRQLFEIGGNLIPHAITTEGIVTSSPGKVVNVWTYDKTYIAYNSNTTTYFVEPGISVSENSVTWRDAAMFVREEYRDIDIIPVLSKVDEEPVTGFFLDNCWWFVTEHSVFGTGVDGDGLATIERFDPLKYFKFSEKITGAIRLSDTSFWVFHDSGAYLIYKTSLTLLDGTEYRWLCTATAKSKGCDFLNALSVLPISSNVVTVTSDDICVIQMKENIQSDERSLVPITLPIAANARNLLSQTASIKICTYKYLTIFILNRAAKTDNTPALVYDNRTQSWWYWEFPVKYISHVYQTETNVILLCPDEKVSLSLTTDEYLYRVGALDYEIYADRIIDQTPIQITWGWQSALQIFNTVERRKQLLFTTFVFDDFMPEEDSEQLIDFGYYFNIYSKSYATSRPDSTTATVYRISNSVNKTTIASFNYLQLVVHNSEFEELKYETLTKPKICCISFKYRTLRGELT